MRPARKLLILVATVRLVVLALALAAAACPASYQASELGDDLVPTAGCVIDDDCVLAGPSCCDCPSYATGVDSGWLETCANVACTPPTDGSCAPLVARCQAGTCMAECAPMSCDLSCATGFAADESGCLTCACAENGAPAGCTLDTDCVEVPADCCGCARGGRDTAVLASEVDGFVGALNCPPNMADVPCPDVSTCVAGEAPQCVFGQCQLTTAGAPPPMLPPGACGRPDLPPCPDGEVCLINQDPGAGPLGLGVCSPTPMP
ncbi:MAG: hypothetical protein IPL61_40295 [Myxococcales bacterium]|nr:hypothetical protein [Myxococcales bacterium]